MISSLLEGVLVPGKCAALSWRKAGVPVLTSEVLTVQGNVLRTLPRLTQRQEEGRHSKLTWNLCSGGGTVLTPHPSNLSHPS